MKLVIWSAFACASFLLTGCPQDQHAQSPASMALKATTAKDSISKVRSPAKGTTSEVTLTLGTQPVSAEVSKGDRYSVTMFGTWQNTGSGAVYLQVSDSAATFVAPAPMPGLKFSSYHIPLPLPASTAPGLYTGSLTVRACADSLCTQPYAGTAHSISYTVKVNAVGEWETLQRTSRHDGYVPVQVDAMRYRQAWTWVRPSPGGLSPVVTSGSNVYFSETGYGSVYAVRAADGVTQWRRALTGTVNPPTVSNGYAYVATTGHQDTWLFSLRASDGQQSYQSQFSTQWATLLNPTVRNGKVYINSGYYGGVVYAFDQATGSAAWNASGGTYGMNSPAADDQFVYSYNGSSLSVFDAGTGSLYRTIGPNPGGVQTDYNGTVMLGSAGHVFAYSSTAYSLETNRQLVDFSVADQAARWMSIALYSSYPAVAKGVVYATSNETRSFDALDESTGQKLWSWKPKEQTYSFVGNVVVTDNIAFVSTKTRIYAIDLQTRRTVWSAPTPGMMSLAANRMLYVSSPVDGYYQPNGRITAYRMY